MATQSQDRKALSKLMPQLMINILLIIMTSADSNFREYHSGQASGYNQGDILQVEIFVVIDFKKVE